MTENFVFRKEWREALKGCNAEVRAEVYEAVLAYAFDNEFIEICDLAKMAFNFIKLQIDSMREVYKEKCERNRARANKRWDKENAEVCQAMPSDAEVCQAMPSDAIKSNQIKSNQNNISLSFEEREKIFEIFYFERNLATAKEECEKFINHYEANGWCRGNSEKPVKNKIALAKSWKVETEKKRYPDDVNKWLYQVYLKAKEQGEDSECLITKIETIYTEKGKVIVQCTRNVATICEMFSQIIPRSFELTYRIKREG